MGSRRPNSWVDMVKKDADDYEELTGLLYRLPGRPMCSYALENRFLFWHWFGLSWDTWNTVDRYSWLSRENWSDNER